MSKKISLWFSSVIVSAALVAALPVVTFAGPLEPPRKETAITVLSLVDRPSMGVLLTGKPVQYSTDTPVGSQIAGLYHSMMSTMSDEFEPIKGSFELSLYIDLRMFLKNGNDTIRILNVVEYEPLFQRERVWAAPHKDSAPYSELLKYDYASVLDNAAKSPEEALGIYNESMKQIEGMILDIRLGQMETLPLTRSALKGDARGLQALSTAEKDWLRQLYQQYYEYAKPLQESKRAIVRDSGAVSGDIAIIVDPNNPGNSISIPSTIPDFDLPSWSDLEAGWTVKYYPKLFLKWSGKDAKGEPAGVGYQFN